MQDQINELESKINANNNKISDNKASVNDLLNQISDMQAQLDVYNAKITDLNKQIAAKDEIINNSSGGNRTDLQAEIDAANIQSSKADSRCRRNRTTNLKRDFARHIRQAKAPALEVLLGSGDYASFLTTA